MAYNHEYPYVDPNRYNSDWILNKIKELMGEIDTFVALNKITFAGEWDITKQYPAWTIVNTNNGTEGYISIKPVPAGVTIDNTEYWVSIVNYTATIADLQNRVIVLENDILDIHNTIVTPEMFGAVGDGVTDDSAAFQDAIDSGAFVLLTNSYLVHDINVTKKTHIIGNNGVIVLDDNGNAKPFENVFTVSAPFYIDGVSFTGNNYVGALTDRNSVIVADTCDEVVIRNCSFNGIGYSYANVTAPYWELIPILVKAVDVKRVVFSDNDIIGGGGDELFSITPHNLTAADAPEVIFEGNKFMNVGGASINLLAGKVMIHGNYFYGHSYNGSVFNLAADTLEAYGNTYINCNVKSVYDASEGCTLRATDLFVHDEVFDGTCTTYFVDCASKNVTVMNCNVSSNSFIRHEITVHADSTVPAMLQNTSDKHDGNINIMNNSVRIKGSGGGSVLRLAAINAYVTGDIPSTDYKMLGRLAIKDNSFIWDSFFYDAGKGFVQMIGLFESVTFSGNLIVKPNGDSYDSTSTSKYLIGINDNAIDQTLMMKTLTFTNNTVILDTIVNAKVGIIQAPGGYIGIDVLNAYINTGDNFAVNITQANTINTDM